MADKPLFLVTFRHPHSNEIEHAVEVSVCTTCGCIFAHVDHRLGQCPLGHDQ